MEAGRQYAPLRSFYEHLTRFARVIRLDKRGTGLSDRVAGVPTLETRMDDIRAVMDAAGSDRAVMWSGMEGSRSGPTSWPAAPKIGSCPS